MNVDRVNHLLLTVSDMDVRVLTPVLELELSLGRSQYVALK